MATRNGTVGRSVCQPEPVLMATPGGREDDEAKFTSFPVRYDYDDRVENRGRWIRSVCPRGRQSHRCLYLPVFTFLIHIVPRETARSRRARGDSGVDSAEICQ